MQFEALLRVNLCLIALLSSEQCSQFERFRMQHVQMVNKMPCFKTKCIGNNNAEASRVNCNIFWCLTFPRSRQQNPHSNYCSANSGQRSWHLTALCPTPCTVFTWRHSTALARLCRARRTSSSPTTRRR